MFCVPRVKIDTSVLPESHGPTFAMRYGMGARGESVHGA